MCSCSGPVFFSSCGTLHSSLPSMLILLFMMWIEGIRVNKFVREMRGAGQPKLKFKLELSCSILDSKVKFRLTSPPSPNVHDLLKAFEEELLLCHFKGKNSSSWLIF